MYVCLSFTTKQRDLDCGIFRHVSLGACGFQINQLINCKLLLHRLKTIVQFNIGKPDHMG